MPKAAPVLGQGPFDGTLSNNETSIEFHPTNPNIVVAGSNGAGDQRMSFSSDGGVTWGAPTRRTSVTSSNLSDSFEWGDYNGLDVAGVDIMAIYTDNRDESGGSASHGS